MTQLRRFARGSLRPVPWKNGGGETRELACLPEGAGWHDFDWRVSIATIAKSGAFSAFAGVDRQILLLEGDGVHLRSADGAIDHRLDRPGQPFSFAGEAALEGVLLGGASTDLNLMTRRARCEGRLQVVDDAPVPGPGLEGLALVLAGRWQLQGAGTAEPPLAPGEGLAWRDLPPAAILVPLARPARLAWACIVRIPSHPSCPARACA